MRRLVASPVALAETVPAASVQPHGDEARTHLERGRA